MDIISAVVLGLVQGFTEFLPVSSSGHLVIVQSLFEDFEQPGLLYDTLLHLATLFAVLVFFRRRIRSLILAFFGYFFMRYRSYYFAEKDMLRGIIIATIPTGIIGFLLKDASESVFSNVTVVGYFLIITSVMLFLADKLNPRRNAISFKSALIVGIVQGFAVFPGISRSGSTIFAGLRTGISRQTAAEFSFLISMPAIIGATILQIGHIESVQSSELITYGFGMLAAFISGLLAIGIMLRVVRNAKMRYFAIYCLLLGIIAVIWL